MVPGNLVPKHVRNLPLSTFYLKSQFPPLRILLSRREDENAKRDLIRHLIWGWWDPIGCGGFGYRWILGLVVGKSRWLSGWSGRTLRSPLYDSPNDPRNWVRGSSGLESFKLQLMPRRKWGLAGGTKEREHGEGERRGILRVPGGLKKKGIGSWKSNISLTSTQINWMNFECLWMTSDFLAGHGHFPHFGLRPPPHFNPMDALAHHHFKLPPPLGKTH